MASEDQTEVFTGQCTCGHVKFEATLSTKDGIPAQALCHCRSCKRMTGGVFTRSVLVPKDNMRLVGGEPARYRHRPAGSKWENVEDPPLGWYFCPTCGVQVFSENSEFVPGMYVMRIGTLDRQDEFTKVQMQLFCRSRDPWLKEALELTEGTFETQPGQ